MLLGLGLDGGMAEEVIVPARALVPLPAGVEALDGGNPVGPSKTVLAGGVVEDRGGANPASGYSLIEASVRGD